MKTTRKPALALLTEGLQHFASHRDPSWFDVGVDMAGAAVGLLLANKPIMQ